jgi:hypothetical protein
LTNLTAAATETFRDAESQVDRQTLPELTLSAEAAKIQSRQPTGSRGPSAVESPAVEGPAVEGPAWKTAFAAVASFEDYATTGKMNPGFGCRRGIRSALYTPPKTQLQLAATQPSRSGSLPAAPRPAFDRSNQRMTPRATSSRNRSQLTYNAKTRASAQRLLLAWKGLPASAGLSCAGLTEEGGLAEARDFFLGLMLSVLQPLVALPAFRIRAFRVHLFDVQRLLFPRSIFTALAYSPRLHIHRACTSDCRSRRPAGLHCRRNSARCQARRTSQFEKD